MNMILLHSAWSILIIVIRVFYLNDFVVLLLAPLFTLLLNYVSYFSEKSAMIFSFVRLEVVEMSTNNGDKHIQKQQIEQNHKGHEKQRCHTRICQFHLVVVKLTQQHLITSQERNGNCCKIRVVMPQY